MFIGVAATLSYAALVTVMFAVFIGLTLFAAIVFERWIDRSAIALSRRIPLVGSLISGAIE